MAFWLAKGLQMAGLIVVASALLKGLAGMSTLKSELFGAVAGASLFYAGRAVEAASGRGR